MAWTPWHSGSLSEGLRQTPGVRASDPAGPVALRLWLQTAMAKHAFEPESQSLLQNNSESLLDPKAFPMIPLSEVNSLKSLPPQPDARPASWRPWPSAGLWKGVSPQQLRDSSHWAPWPHGLKSPLCRLQLQFPGPALGRTGAASPRFLSQRQAPCWPLPARFPHQRHVQASPCPGGGQGRPGRSPCRGWGWTGPHSGSQPHLPLRALPDGGGAPWGALAPPRPTLCHFRRTPGPQAAPRRCTSFPGQPWQEEAGPCTRG